MLLNKSNVVSIHSENNISFANGQMHLAVKKESQGTRAYTGAEIRTKDSYLYGKFVVSMKPAKGSGIISSFFTFRDPIDPWNEIDIELLGNDATLAQFNHWNRAGNEHPVRKSLGFDAADEFHEYTIEWQPEFIKWRVDGVITHIAKTELPSHSQRIIMNLWVSGNESFGGNLDETRLPNQAEYDYVRYYRLKQ